MGAEHDAVLRLALAAMAADPASSLSPEQRRWVIALVQRTRPLTPSERRKLRIPLVVWLKEKMPRCVAFVEKQYADAHEGRT